MDIEKEARFNRAQKKKEKPTTSRHNTKNTKNAKNTKNTTAARMPPKGTSGRGGISNPPCMADAKEEMPKEKQQRKKDEEKATMKKGQRKKRQDLRCFFSSLVLQGRREGRFVASRVEGREGSKAHFAMELCFK